MADKGTTTNRKRRDLVPTDAYRPGYPDRALRAADDDDWDDINDDMREGR